MQSPQQPQVQQQPLNDSQPGLDNKENPPGGGAQRYQQQLQKFRIEVEQNLKNTIKPSFQTGSQQINSPEMQQASSSFQQQQQLQQSSQLNYHQQMPSPQDLPQNSQSHTHSHTNFLQSPQPLCVNTNYINLQSQFNGGGGNNCQGREIIHQNVAPVNYIIKDVHHHQNSKNVCCKDPAAEEQLNKIKQKNKQLKEELRTIKRQDRQQQRVICEPQVYYQPQPQPQMISGLPEIGRIESLVKDICCPPPVQVAQQQPKDTKIELQIAKGCKHDKCLKKLCKKNHQLIKEHQESKADKEKYAWQVDHLKDQIADLRDKNSEQEMTILRLEGDKKDLTIKCEQLSIILKQMEEQMEKIKEGKIQQVREVKEKIVEREIEKPVEIIKHVVVEKIVEKPIEIIKNVELPPKIVEKIVEVPVEKIVERKIEVPVEVIKEVPIEKIIEVPVDRIVEVPVEKIVHIPYDRIVEVPVEKIIEKIVEVPKIIEKIVEVEQPTLIRETIEVREHNQSLINELNLMRHQQQQLSIEQDNALRQLEEQRRITLEVEDRLVQKYNEEAIQNANEKNQLFFQLRDSRLQIEDLQSRLDQMMQEINNMNRLNQEKNVELTNYIRQLENQLRTRQVINDTYGSINVGSIGSTGGFNQVNQHPAPQLLRDNNGQIYQNTASFPNQFQPQYQQQLNSSFGDNNQLNM